MKTLYLHIGSHKTGTTSIQKTLLKNQNLLENSDYHLFSILSSGKENPSGNSSVSWFLRDRNYQNRIYSGIGTNFLDTNLLAKKLNLITSDNLIVSAEDFSWVFRKKEIVSLHKSLSGYFKVKIIVYIRRQDKHIISHFQQSMKHNTSPAFGYYRSSTSKSIPNGRMNYDEYLNYYRKISMWSDIFGEENMIIRVFDTERLYKQDSVLDFLSILSLENLDIKPLKENTSNGFESTKVGHLINHSDINTDIGSLIRKNLDNSGKSLPSKQEAVDFYERYKQSNIKLNEKFKISEQYPDIFNGDFSDYPDYPKDIWTEDTANQAIANILNSISQLNDLDANLLRDAAVSLENHNIKLSFQLMSLALVLRPNGPFIRKKVDEYKQVVISNL